MQRRQLGAHGPHVSALGLGCMGMSMGYGRGDDTQSLETLRRAIDLGITFFDTADIYGDGHNEMLVGKALKPVREKVVLATKMGFKKGDGVVLDGSPAYIQSACEEGLKNLGVETIDLYYLHRVDPKTPIEVSIEAMAGLVRQGKIRHIGISEVKPETIRRAAAIHPIAAVQTEYSLWERAPEAEILQVCRDLGIGFVPYSPLGRGFLSGTIHAPELLEKEDFRHLLPRFQRQNFEKNKQMLLEFEEFAREKNAPPAALALSWLLAQGEDIVPIPGTKKVSYLEENIEALTISLSPSDLATLNRLFPVGAAHGRRYPEIFELER